MNELKPGEIGRITKEIIDLLDLSIEPNTPIYLGESNIEHMLSKHPKDYEKYGIKLPEIIGNPDYIGFNHKDGSIEYVKEFLVHNEYVKAAVRISTNGKFFARSLYVLNKNRVDNFIIKGTLKRLKKP